jgi:phosphatidylglycerophosphate synthase
MMMTPPTATGMADNAAREAFGGAGKVGESIFARPERRLVARYVDRIPTWLETYHLTLLTIVWSLLTLGCGWLARGDIRWLWLVSLWIVCQYITDLFDGAVGRKRDTGLVRWGFFMDHFLDYIFLCALITAYYIVAPDGLAIWFMLLLGLTGAHMTHSFLAFAATNEFRIAFHGIGPTEMRIAFIGVNAFIIFTWPRYYDVTLPALTIVVLLALIYVVISTQRRLWAMDMEARRARLAAVVEREARTAPQ